MMIQAFYTGVSGLKSNQTAIDVTSDNIANVSTTGFRANKAEFSNLYEQSIFAQGGSSVNPASIGAGTRIQATSMVTEDGSYSLSDRSTDMAIEGSGWFGVSGEQGKMYTRAGNFTFDRESSLVTPNGHYVLGTMGGNIDYGTNTLNGVLNDVPLGDIDATQPLRFPKTLTFPAKATTNIKLFGNVGLGDKTSVMGGEIIDAQGNKNHLKLEFTKSEDILASGSKWNVTATVQSQDGTTIYDNKFGEVVFSPEGKIVSNTITTMDNNGSQVNVDLGTDFNGVVSTASNNIKASSQSDGKVGGDLVGYDVNRNAEVVATFSNGAQSAVGQIAIYHFINEQGLERSGAATFKESGNSGEPYFKKGVNGENIVGAKVTTFQLENSNVAIEEALTELIILQRSYDANSKSVTTADEMIQKALNMSK
jgi:flagellar hook protein FlgE